MDANEDLEYWHRSSRSHWAPVFAMGKMWDREETSQVKDQVLIASHMIVALQQIVSRVANPKIPSVLSFGRVEALGATNVIPNEVKIQGTFRTLDEAWRAKAHEKMLQIAHGIVEGMGGELDFEIRKGYPFLKNNPELNSKNQ